MNGLGPSPGFDADLYCAFNDLPRIDDQALFKRYLQNYCGEHYSSAGSLISSPNCFTPPQRDQIDALVRTLSRRQPEFQNKWKSQHYLCAAFGKRRRLRALVFNYRYMLERLHFEHLFKLLTHGMTLWSSFIDGEKWSLSLVFSPVFWEGELSLTFSLDNRVIYLVSFSIIEGDAFTFDEPCSVLITRLQGAIGQYETIKKASKAFHDVSPLYIAFSALQGLMNAFNIKRLIGIAAAFHAARAHGKPVDLEEKYDNFYTKVGLTKFSPEIYTALVPILDKPLSEIKKGHRLRTKVKRAFKHAIMQTVQEAVVEMIRTEMT